MLNEGITEVGAGGRIVSKVTNFDSVDKSIPAGTVIGNLFLAEKADNLLQ